MSRMNVTDTGIDWARIRPEHLEKLAADTMAAATLPLTATKYSDGTVIDHDPADRIRRDGQACTSRHYGCQGDYVTADGRAICTRWALEHLKRYRFTNALPANNAAVFAAHVTQSTLEGVS